MVHELPPQPCCSLSCVCYRKAAVRCVVDPPPPEVSHAHIYTHSLSISLSRFASPASFAFFLRPSLRPVPPSFLPCLPPSLLPALHHPPGTAAAGLQTSLKKKHKTSPNMRETERESYIYRFISIHKICIFAKRGLPQSFFAVQNTV